ncbi:YfcC family protein [Mycoplasma mycoides]|uniref:YfcC family protein n=1 Tax=Mycoplasma mycoides TaxID=2102 RepID=UPI00223FAA4E|nr:YfcC family protein [Mycoplasma mycoides]QVK06714.1 YfcC family protein [Mycoplasma mycoides subsp. capri]
MIVSEEKLINKQNKIAKKKHKVEMISAFSILFLIIAILIILSWIFKWTNTTVKIKQSQEKIIALGFFDLFKAPLKGFVQRAQIIVFVLTMGAYINVIVASKALEGFSQTIVRKMKGKEIWSLIPLMIFFSICGTTVGLAEEVIAFQMICIPLMVAAGFDKFTGLIAVLIGTGVGVLTSTVNPFAIGIAVTNLNKGLDKQITSVSDGLIWRIICWIILTALSIVLVMLYAKKVKKDQTKSVVFKTLTEDKEFYLFNSAEKIVMDWKKKVNLVVFLISLILMVVYLIGWDDIFHTTHSADFARWIRNNIPYLTGTDKGFGNGSVDSVAAIFLITAIIMGIINGSSEKQFLKDFINGASRLLNVCLIIAVAAGIGWILKESHMQELFVESLSNSLGSLKSPILILLIMFIFFIPLSFLIPSTSGFATAVFPLLGGVVIKNTDILASGSITAFSFASGLVNLITPTSGIVMGSIAVARMDYAKFIKSMAPYMLILTTSSLILLLVGAAIGKTIA